MSPIEEEKTEILDRVAALQREINKASSYRSSSEYSVLQNLIAERNEALAGLKNYDYGHILHNMPEEAQQLFEEAKADYIRCTQAHTQEEAPRKNSSEENDHHRPDDEELLFPIDMDPVG